MRRIDPESIEIARRRLAPIIEPTIARPSRELSDLAGREVIVKPEHLQRTGSFKVRGAYNRIAVLAAEGVEEVVAASAGNHAQGVALAGSLCGVRTRIFMPENVSLPKLVATRSYGASVELVGEVLDESIGAARAYGERTGAVFVPPFDDDLVIAGQGTIGLELAEEAPHIETVLVPIGGGGLIAGVATALRARNSTARIVGVEAAGAASMIAALETGAPVRLDRVDTVADGIAMRSVCERTLSAVQNLVDEVVTVDDEEISKAILVLLERCKWVVEPAGAVGLAALLAGKVTGSGPVAVVLSGGNVDPILLSRLIEHGMVAAGRYVTARVVIADRPGSLAALATALGQLGLNLLSVEHRRAGLEIGLREVEVLFTAETRDPGHREEIVARLGSEGYAVHFLV